MARSSSPTTAATVSGGSPHRRLRGDDDETRTTGGPGRAWPGGVENLTGARARERGQAEEGKAQGACGRRRSLVHSRRESNSEAECGVDCQTSLMFGAAVPSPE